MSQPASESNKSEGLFQRILTFFKEVLTELKKVQRPTGQELWQLFLTVVFFVAMVMIFVGILDVVFNQSMFWIFG